MVRHIIIIIIIITDILYFDNILLDIIQVPVKMLKISNNQLR